MNFKIYLQAIILAVSLNAYTKTIEKGLFSVAGSGALSTKIESFNNITMDLNLKPSVSYMICDNWELGVKPSLSIPLKHLLPDLHNVKWGVETFTRKYFTLSPALSYYTGLSLGFKTKDFFTDTGGVIEIQNGLMISLNKSVSLDVGLPIKANIEYYSGYSQVNIQITAGYFGVKAFF